MEPSLFILPVITLIIGLLSLFSKTESDRNKNIFVILLFISLILSCSVSIYFNVDKEKRNQVEYQNKVKDNEGLKSDIGFLKGIVKNLSDSVGKNFNRVFDLFHTQALANQEKTSNTIVNKKDTGYAYYGINYDNIWTERYFDNLTSEKLSMPKIGDVVTSISNINARAGYIELVNTNWVNKKVIGAIKPSEKFEVLEVKSILGSFMWIKFRKI